MVSIKKGQQITLFLTLKCPKLRVFDPKIDHEFLTLKCPKLRVFDPKIDVITNFKPIFPQTHSAQTDFKQSGINGAKNKYHSHLCLRIWRCIINEFNSCR
jgi:hypothetical protein